MSLNFKLLFLISTFHSFNALSQIDQRPLIKVGGFIYPRYLTDFALNFERESAFKRHEAFTHGFRLDYYKAKPYPPKFFPGNEDLILGYEFKFYPFYFKSHKPYRGVFIGIDPCYFIKVKNYYRYGPGLCSLFGYQHVFKNKVSIAFEIGMTYMQNVNSNVPKHNPDDRYFAFLQCIKVGIKL